MLKSCTTYVVSGQRNFRFNAFVPPQFPPLVDAGGGKGQDLNLFLEKYPTPGNGSLVLEELPSVVENIPYNLDESIKLVAHDLFEPQPIRGEPTYVSDKSHLLTGDETQVPVHTSHTASSTAGQMQERFPS